MTTTPQPGAEPYRDLVEKFDGRVDRPRWEAVKVWLTGWLIRLVERRNPGRFDATVYDEPCERDHGRVPGGLGRVLLVVAVAVLLMVIVATLADPGPMWGVRIVPENHPA